MDYSQIAFLLLLIGLALVFAEVFIPSGGMLMLLSLCCIAGSIWSGHTEWYASSPRKFWMFFGTAFILIPIVGGLAFYTFPKTSFGRKLLLQAPKLEDVTPFIKEAEHLKSLIGLEGRTASLLKPSGMVLINGERLNCRSEGAIISPDIPVVVLDVKEMNLIVRQIDESAERNTKKERNKIRNKYDFEVPNEISESEET